jgi:hypothetical protein
LKLRRGYRENLIARLADALSWCGGSADFAVGGRARRGWTASVLPLLKEAAALRARRAVRR